MSAKYTVSECKSWTKAGYSPVAAHCVPPGDGWVLEVSGYRVKRPDGSVLRPAYPPFATREQAEAEAARLNLDPDMTAPIVMDRPCIFRLATGEEHRCDPYSRVSLDAAEEAIRQAACRLGVDGRVVFDAARRQLGDIAVTRKARLFV